MSKVHDLGRTPVSTPDVSQDTSQGGIEEMSNQDRMACLGLARAGGDGCGDPSEEADAAFRAANRVLATRGRGEYDVPVLHRNTLEQLRLAFVSGGWAGVALLDQAVQDLEGVRSDLSVPGLATQFDRLLDIERYELIYEAAGGQVDEMLEAEQQDGIDGGMLAGQLEELARELRGIDRVLTLSNAEQAVGWADWAPVQATDPQSGGAFPIGTVSDAADWLQLASHGLKLAASVETARSNQSDPDLLATAEVTHAIVQSIPATLALILRACANFNELSGQLGPAKELRAFAVAVEGSSWVAALGGLGGALAVVRGLRTLNDESASEDDKALAVIQIIGGTGSIATAASKVFGVAALGTAGAVLGKVALATAAAWIGARFTQELHAAVRGLRMDIDVGMLQQEFNRILERAGALDELFDGVVLAHNLSIFEEDPTRRQAFIDQALFRTHLVRRNFRERLARANDFRSKQLPRHMRELLPFFEGASNPEELAFAMQELRDRLEWIANNVRFIAAQEQGRVDPGGEEERERLRNDQEARLQGQHPLGQHPTL